MESFGIVVAIGVAALIAYASFGGPRIPADLRRAIDEVVASEVPELVEGEAGFASSATVRLWYEATEHLRRDVCAI